MLEQQSIISQPNANVQHLRNNLTPSPLHSDPQRYSNQNNTQSLNMVNVTNPNLDVPWFSGNTELNNYQGWLATNTIQTQSFMLNTLNQCCQMLWLQQRELVSLRNVVSMVRNNIKKISVLIFIVCCCSFKNEWRTNMEDHKTIYHLPSKQLHKTIDPQINTGVIRIIKSIMYLLLIPCLILIIAIATTHLIVIRILLTTVTVTAVEY